MNDRNGAGGGQVGVGGICVGYLLPVVLVYERAPVHGKAAATVVALVVSTSYNRGVLLVPRHLSQADVRGPALFTLFTGCSLLVVCSCETSAGAGTGTCTREINFCSRRFLYSFGTRT